MAAPADRTINSLGGRWLMNHKLSDSIEPGLALQGISFLLRKTISYASVTLEITQYEGPPKPPNTSTTPATHIDIQQIATAGMKGTREERCLDSTERPHSDWIFGNVRGQSRWLSLSEIEDDFLRSNWLEGDEEKTGPEGKDHVWSFVRSVDSDWTAEQIWGFQTIEGERRYCRNIVIRKGDERVNMRLVYDYLGPLE
ncbi:hypothetical protein VUR80DRAFT_4478 [Thermomyces stellatus]